MNEGRNPQLWLVIPAWCEEARLDAFVTQLLPALTTGDFSVAVQIVDDGSPAYLAHALAARCEVWRARWPSLQPLHRLPVNRGKGGAVYAGWDLAPDSVVWLGFCDADGSIDADEVVRLLGLAFSTTKPACLCASRHLPGSNAQWSSPLRRLLSHLFATAMRLRTGLAVRDSQCGCKLISRAVYKAVRADLREQRFIFDVELLLACRHAGTEIREIPVRWVHRPGGKLRLWRDGPSMLRRLGKLGHRFSKKAAAKS